MGDWPARTHAWGDQAVVIGNWHPWCLGPGYKAFNANNAPASAAWPSTNRAIFVPFRLPAPFTAYQIVTGCGSSAGGNFDVGIYDRNGTRLVSSGSTGRAAAAEVILNITDTFLGPGMYYLAMAVDGTNNMLAQTFSGSVASAKFWGILQATSAFSLPSSVTYETSASAYCPSLAVYLRSQ